MVIQICASVKRLGDTTGVKYTPSAKVLTSVYHNKIVKKAVMSWKYNTYAAEKSHQASQPMLDRRSRTFSPHSNRQDGQMMQNSTEQPNFIHQKLSIHEKNGFSSVSLPSFIHSTIMPLSSSG